MTTRAIWQRPHPFQLLTDEAGDSRPIPLARSVFGDIGTSPLYTMNIVFDAAYGPAPSAANVVGVVSLILWSLVVVAAPQPAGLRRIRHEGDLPLALALRTCAAQGLSIEPMKASYFLSHAVVVPTRGQGMSLWREKLYAAMSHDMANMASYLKLPANRVIELGSRVEI